MQKPTNPPALPEPKTKEQIARDLNISLRTLQRKLKKAGLEVPRGFVSPEVQNLILERLGWKKVS
jgi:DNA-binding transcriptional regulator LsrR (DeoR family)